LKQGLYISKWRHLTYMQLRLMHLLIVVSRLFRSYTTYR